MNIAKFEKSVFENEVFENEKRIIKKRIREHPMNFINNIDEYAKIKTKHIMQNEGESRVNKHNESFQDINISSYLSKIRSKKREYGLILAIKNQTIKSFFVFQGEEDRIEFSSYFLNLSNGLCAVDFINEWAKQGADICNYHCHPFRIAARPSIPDYQTLCPEKRTEDVMQEWEKCVREYGKNTPSGFHYADWGVVTKYDFFSYKQFSENGGDLDREIDKLKKEIQEAQCELADID